MNSICVIYGPNKALIVRCLIVLHLEHHPLLILLVFFYELFWCSFIRSVHSSPWSFEIHGVK
uniref:Uncharacterized protein n=1 Tax=Rhizophora mucronata TaxID=61149 RepID=A0A2P2N159_RHIMU